MKRSGVIYPEEEFLEVNSGSPMFENSIGQQDESSETEMDEINVVNYEQNDEDGFSSTLSGNAMSNLNYDFEEEDNDQKHNYQDDTSANTQSDSEIEQEILARSKSRFPNLRFKKRKRRLKRKSKFSSRRKKSKRKRVSLPRLKIKSPRLHQRSNKRRTDLSDSTRKDNDNFKNSFNDYDSIGSANGDDFGKFQETDNVRDALQDKDYLDLDDKSDNELDNSDDRILSGQDNRSESSDSKKSDSNEAARQLVTSGDIMVRVIIAAILGIFGFFYIFTQLGIF